MTGTLSERPLVFGTRGSALARWQTQSVLAALHQHAPHRVFELRVITTSGDRDQTRALSDFGGRGAFTSELESALRAGEIDVAVHSLKDLPAETAPDLTIAGIPERADPGDVLVSRHGVGLQQLPRGARVGTSSARRAAQLRALRPDLEIVPLRGNVDTRLKKAASADYDAIVLAAAGLVRLGYADAITEYFSIEQILPDPGQGALAVQVRASDAEIVALVTRLDHAPTRRAVTAERAFLRALGGGCRTPMAAYAETHGDTLHLYGMLAAEDGTGIVRADRVGLTDQPEALGSALAAQLAMQIRMQVSSLGASSGNSSAPPLRGKRIVITRAAAQADELAQKIRAQGGEPLLFPTIEIAPLEDFGELDAHLVQLGKWDWVVFTSANGVGAVTDRLRGLGMSLDVLKGTQVAAIGTGTANALQELGVRVDFIPSEFLGAQIAQELPAAPGDRGLLLRADLASDELARGLQARGITVSDVDAYRTLRATPPPLDWTRADAITFTSASTVHHCWDLLNEEEREELARRDIFCIGPVTAEAARTHGLPLAAVAAEHTLDGLVAAIQNFYSETSHVD